MVDTTKYPYRPGDPYAPKIKPFSQLTSVEQTNRQKEVGKEVEAMKKRLEDLGPDYQPLKYPYRPGDPYYSKPKEFMRLTSEDQAARKAEVAKEVENTRKMLEKLGPIETKKKLEEEAVETVEEAKSKVSSLNTAASILGLGTLAGITAYLMQGKSRTLRKRKTKRKNKTHRRKH
jgi:hypothetical protein